MKNLLIIALFITAVCGNNGWNAGQSKPWSTNPNQGQVWRPRPQTQCNTGFQQQQQQQQQQTNQIWHSQPQGFRPIPNENLVKPGDAWPRPSSNGWGRPLTSTQARPRPNTHQRPLVDVPYTIEIVNHRPQQSNTGGWKR